MSFSEVTNLIEEKGWVKALEEIQEKYFSSQKEEEEAEKRYNKACAEAAYAKMSLDNFMTKAAKAGKANETKYGYEVGFITSTNESLHIVLGLDNKLSIKKAPLITEE
jgi:hypothetical protein